MDCWVQTLTDICDCLNHWVGNASPWRSPYNETKLRGDGHGWYAPEAQRIKQRSWLYLNTKGTRGWLASDKQIPTVEWTNCWCKCLPEPEQDGQSERVAQLEYKKITKNRLSKRATGLHWLEPTYSFLTTEDAQQLDNKHTVKISNRNAIVLVSERFIAIVIFF